MTIRTILGAALLAIVTHAAPAAPTPLESEVDALVQDGFERPEHARAVLARLQREHTDSIRERRILLQALGMVEASDGAAVHANAIAEQLQTLAADDPSGQALAASNLVRAKVADAAGLADVAAALAQAALPAFQAGCVDVSAKATLPASCEFSSVWNALQLLERRATGLGIPVTAAKHAQAALELAEAAGDSRRQLFNLRSLALFAQRRGESDAAARWMAHARRVVGPAGDLALQAELSNAQAYLAAIQGDDRGSLQSFEEALVLAGLTKAPRMEARILSNLSDTYARLGRPADALRAGERALPILRSHHDLRSERILLNNIGIAKIGVGRLAEGKQDLNHVLDLWQQTGETGRQVQTLTEFGEALARAGDARGALELYHRERALSAELMRANREAALKDLRTRNDAEARKRDIELLARDNALKTEALANRGLQQSIWWLLAAVMALASVVIAMLYLRVRETHRRLAASHVQLRTQSERDPLTNLANRRHFQAVMAQSGTGTGFAGALLLIDVDHFKRVNDVHGHGVGDQVLVEVAKRLNEAVRSDDLVVRWGGEEFLILAQRVTPEQAQQMAERVLQVLGATPVEADATTVRVTASIGYAHFPLPPHATPVPWEQAINLADMALYTAKSQGRNRAVGIASTTASSREALRDVESDFDRAWHAGRVTLLQTPGPEPIRAAA
jgi:diguanylate cyclase (GGDEF)-like protein